jgi:signal transduction histidine kinase
VINLSLSPKHWHLRSKVLLHIIVFGVSAAIILTFIYIRTEKRLIRATSQQKVQIVSSLVNAGLYRAMQTGHEKEVQSKMEEIASSTAIKKIRILSPLGKVLRSTEPKEVGKPVGGQDQGSLAQFLTRNIPSEISMVKAQSLAQSFLLIENKRECLGCHAASEKITGILEVQVDNSEAESLLRKNQWKGIVAALAALSLLTFIILRLFERIINRPLSRLKNEMQSYQVGHLAPLPMAVKNDEIGSLVENFNLMVTRLEAAQQKIEELYSQRIQKAEHLASFGELAASLVHDVKNPLSGIRGAIEIIHQKTAPADPRKEIFGEILVQTDKIITILQDALNYAKPGAVNFRYVNPNVCAENAIRLATTQLDGKDISIRFEGVRPESQVYIDPDKIQDVLLNLILNSISAIEKKGQVEIRMHLGNGNQFQVVVSDDGQGIPEAFRGQIFNPFFSTRKNGAGLGLSICKRIIEAHKGSIRVESQVGKGTTVFIEIPATAEGN